MSGVMKIYGLIGRAVNYSYSPLIHNTAFEQLELPCRYTIFNIAEETLVADALKGARALGIAGFSVTIPYKTTVVPLMDSLSEEAQSIQAVNTIVNHEGTLFGHNTDIAGFAAPSYRTLNSLRAVRSPFLVAEEPPVLQLRHSAASSARQQ